MARYLLVNPMRFQSRVLPLRFPSLTLAEKCMDAYTKAGLSVSLNLKNLTITIYP